jgi:hypothetical protein
MALQHLRSSTANKRPDPTAMAEGQLALNTANASPGLFYKDATGSLIKSGPVHIGATAPNATPAAGGHAGNSVGEAWLDTSGTNPLLKIYNGASFVTVQPVASGTVVSTADTGTVTSTMILDGTILNADINASAAIVDTKLATIATGGKVSNSATTATNANTASAIVARDASGNFTAGTITAALTGAASSNVLKAGDTMTGALVVPLASAATPSLTFTGDLDTGVFSPGANQLAAVTNGIGRLFIDATGNVGVGPIQSPSWASASSTVLSILDSAFSNVAALRVVGPTTITEVGAGPSFTFAGSFSNHPYQLYTNSIERLRITSAGLVGIGTSTVSRSLHIAQAKSTAYSSSDFEQDYQILRLNNTTDDGSVGLEFQVGTNGQAAITADEVTDGNTDICFGTRGSGARTEKVRITSAGLVGVGTSSPTYFLQVKTNTAPNVNKKMLFLEEHTPTSGWSFNIDDNTTGSLFLNKVVTGTESTRITVTNSGNVGIGTTSPLRDLHVSNGGAEGYEFGPGEASNINQTLHYNRSTSVYIENSNRASAHSWDVQTSEKMRLDTSGRLLVGTSTSLHHNAQLQTAGTGYYGYNHFQFSNDAFAPTISVKKSRSASVGGNTIVQDDDRLGTFSFFGADGSTYIQGAGIDAFVDGTPGANDMPGRLVFSTTADGASSPTERMRILSNGHMLLNTTSDLAHLTVVDSTYGASDIFIRTFGLSSNSFVVRGDGDCENTNNAYGAFSDIKLKENIVVASSQWNDIKALQVRNYNLKSNPSFAQIGLVAQEVETVSPGLVSELPDRDEDGNDLGTVTKSVKYSVLYMKAVKALQEAMERIETLEARLTAAGID